MLDRSFPDLPGEEWEKDRSPGPTSCEVLPPVVGIFYLCDADANRCIVEGASFGRDADTIACAVGGLADAFHGASAIREDWIEQCERANEEFHIEVEGDRRSNFYRMATRLVEVIDSEKRVAKDKFDALSETTGREKPQRFASGTPQP